MPGINVGECQNIAGKGAVGFRIFRIEDDVGAVFMGSCTRGEPSHDPRSEGGGSRDCVCAFTFRPIPTQMS